MGAPRKRTCQKVEAISEIDCKSGGNVNAVEARCGQIDCRMCLCQDERRPSQKRRSGAAKEETKQHKN
ncbi:hypothetical protein YC2023_017264 [Brassica napus]